MSLIFQALSWTSGDVGGGEDDDSDRENVGEGEEEEVRYRVGMFGKTRDGRSVHLQVPFQPYFYVEIKPGKSSRVILSRLEERVGDGLVQSRCKVSQHIRLFGFTNGEKGAFLKLVFVSHKAFRQAVWLCKNNLKVQTYESNVDPLLRFMHDAGIKGAGWVEVDDGCYDELMEETTFCDLEYGCEHADLHPPVEEQAGVAPFVLASFDIETYSHDGSFPQPEEEPNVVFQIATTFQRLGEEAPYLRHLANLGGCDDIEGVRIDRCDDEMGVLLSWARAIRDEQTDVLVGYNVWGFDMEYMYKRGDVFWSEDERWDEFRELGRVRGKLTSLSEKKLASAAYGSQTYRFFDMPGVLQFDLLEHVKKEMKFSNNKLDTVAREVLGETKVDLKPHEMFAKYRGDDGDRMEIGRYCVQDTLLPLRISQKMGILPAILEMAQACHVPAEWILMRGQGARVWSLLLLVRLSRLDLPQVVVVLADGTHLELGFDRPCVKLDDPPVQAHVVDDVDDDVTQPQLDEVPQLLLLHRELFVVGAVAFLHVHLPAVVHDLVPVVQVATVAHEQPL